MEKTKARHFRNGVAYFLYNSYGNRRKAKGYLLYRWIQLLLRAEIDHTIAEILLAGHRQII